MTIGPDVIFVGPSMPIEEARLILPEAIYLPPAGMGDVLGAANHYCPHSIGLIDGTFLSNMSVFHKEILYAIDGGAWLLGSSSMGALRAAECDDYGMIGVGEIYRKLVSGEIEDDDEVALTHGDAESCFRPLSDAFVTIRATIEGAVNEGLLTPEEAAQLLQLQKQRWFPERRLSSVPEDARSLGIDETRIALIKDCMRFRAIDPKKQDANELLLAIKRLPPGQVPPLDRPNTVRSGVFAATLARDVVVETPDGGGVTLDRIRRYAAICEPDFIDVMRAARRTMALTWLSSVMGGGPTAEEFAEGRRSIAERLGIPDDELEDVFRKNDLDNQGTHILISTEALMVRIENSWLGRSRMGMITEQFNNELRLRGRYEAVKAAAVLQYSAANTVIFEPEPSIQDIFYTHAALSGWDIPTNLHEYIEHNELGSVRELGIAMSISVKAHHALFGTGVLQSPDSPDLVIEDDNPMMSRGR